MDALSVESPSGGRRRRSPGRCRKESVPFCPPPFAKPCILAGKPRIPPKRRAPSRLEAHRPSTTRRPRKIRLLPLREPATGDRSERGDRLEATGQTRYHPHSARL